MKLKLPAALRTELDRYRIPDEVRQRWQAWWADYGQKSSDGWRYQAMARGEGAPKPYHYRWLMPQILGEDQARWQAANTVACAAMVPAMWWLTGSPTVGLFTFTLYGVWGMSRKFPFITDPVAMAAAIVAAAATKHRRWEVAVATALLAGGARETAPVFAALYAWHPLPLIGLVSPAVMSRKPEGPDITDDFSHTCVVDPFKAVWQVRKDTATDWHLYLAPLGGLWLGARGDLRTTLTLIAAYAQLLVAVDTSRLTAWLWPVLADNLSQDPRWPVAFAASAANPWKVAP